MTSDSVEYSVDSEMKELKRKLSYTGDKRQALLLEILRELKTIRHALEGLEQ